MEILSVKQRFMIDHFMNEVIRFGPGYQQSFKDKVGDASFEYEN
jgi:hypothetical protein